MRRHPRSPVCHREERSSGVIGGGDRPPANEHSLFVIAKEPGDCGSQRCTPGWIGRSRQASFAMTSRGRFTAPFTKGSALLVLSQ